MQLAALISTIAEYFRIGLEAGLLRPEDAQDWATSVIEKMAEPPPEIIEVAWSKGLATTMESLRAVPGERDQQLAGRWLLGLLRNRLPTDDEELGWTARRAMHIAQAANLGDNVYYRFDSIDDEISLARNNTYWTIENCRKDLLEALAEYPEPNWGNEA